MYKKYCVFFILVLQLMHPHTSCGQAINGDGIDVKTKIPVGDYSCVKLESSSNIVLFDSDEKNILIEADEKFAPYIECMVIDGCLVVKNKKEAWFNLIKPINIYIPTNHHITKIINRGSGDIYSEKTLRIDNDHLIIISSGSGDVRLNLKCDSIALNKSGSSSIRLSGTASYLSIKSGGSGEIDASKLSANDIDVEMGGSSNAKLKCISLIHTHLRGSSNISIIGNPKIVKTGHDGNNIQLIKE